MMLLTFAALLAISTLVATGLAKAQAPGRVSIPSDTRLHLSTLERTYAVSEDRC